VDLCQREQYALLRSPNAQTDVFQVAHITHKLDDFEIGRPLGRGKYGRVYLARHKESKLVCALKRVRKARIVKTAMEWHLREEIVINSHLAHPNILHMYTWFHDDDSVYMVFEYAAGGELYQYVSMQKGARISEKQAAIWIKSLAEAVGYCHKKHIVHRDIKPENILLDEEHNIKLADFGWSEHSVTDKMAMLCGTTEYLSFELVQNKEYTHAIDLWCIGALTFELLTGHAAFAAKDAVDVYKRIRSLDIRFPSHLELSPDANNFIVRLLRKEPLERMSVDQILQHPFITHNTTVDTNVKSHIAIAVSLPPTVIPHDSNMPTVFSAPSLSISKKIHVVLTTPSGVTTLTNALSPMRIQNISSLQESPKYHTNRITQHSTDNDKTKLLTTARKYKNTYIPKAKKKEIGNADVCVNKT